jgi:hypothetical protein
MNCLEPNICPVSHSLIFSLKNKIVFAPKPRVSVSYPVRVHLGPGIYFCEFSFISDYFYSKSGYLFSVLILQIILQLRKMSNQFC